MNIIQNKQSLLLNIQILIFSYKFGLKFWQSMTYELDGPRSDAAAISLYNGTRWWITGGYNNNRVRLASTEMLIIENGKIIGKEEEPPRLPHQINAHCIARIDENRVFIAGGPGGHALVFDERTRNITNLPSLKCGRYNPACATLQVNNDTMLMVIGGYCNLDINYGTLQGETLNMSKIDKGWRTDRTMLYDIGSYYSGAYVSYDDTRGTVLLGSMEYFVNSKQDLSDKIVNLNSTDGSFEVMPHKLQYARHGHTAVLIPDNHISCE